MTLSWCPHQLTSNTKGLLAQGSWVNLGWGLHQPRTVDKKTSNIKTERKVPNNSVHDSSLATPKAYRPGPSKQSQMGLHQPRTIGMRTSSQNNGSLCHIAIDFFYIYFQRIFLFFPAKFVAGF